jgi:hypothetical protein
LSNIAEARIVAYTQTAWPDLTVAAILSGLSLHSAFVYLQRWSP